MTILFGDEYVTVSLVIDYTCGGILCLVFLLSLPLNPLIFLYNHRRLPLHSFAKLLSHVYMYADLN